MPCFKIGERVERAASLVPESLRHGVVTRVIPAKIGLDLFTEYEVRFDNGAVALFYHTQLRPASWESEPA